MKFDPKIPQIKNWSACEVFYSFDGGDYYSEWIRQDNGYNPDAYNEECNYKKRESFQRLTGKNIEEVFKSEQVLQETQYR